MIRVLFLALLVAGTPAWGQPAGVQDALLTGTLKTINYRGTILIGVREASLPFSFLNKARQPIGLGLNKGEGGPP